MVVHHFKPDSRIGFINNVNIIVNLLETLENLNFVKIGKMSMSDNKLYIDLE